MIHSRLYISTILLLLLSVAVNAAGKLALGKIKSRVIQSESNLWTIIELKNRDTSLTIYLNGYSSKQTTSSIPNGTYTAKLFSVFGDSIEKQVVVSGTTRLHFDVKNYYRIDTSSTSFWTQMSAGDSLKVYVQENGCFSSTNWLCAIYQVDTNFRISYYLYDTINTFLLTQFDLDRLKSIEVSGRQTRIMRVPSLYRSVYSIVLGNQLLEFAKSAPSYIGDIYADRKRRENPKR